MPHAHTILWSLGTFLALYAATLLYRGLFADRARGRRRCPACSADISTGLACPSCRYEAPHERALRATRRHWPMVIAGTLTLAAGIATFIAGNHVRVWATQTGFAPDVELAPLSATATGAAAFGLALAVWAYRGDRSKGRRRCPKCWYDMISGNTLCPECGHTVKHQSHLYRPRRRYRLAGLGAIILLASLSTVGVNRYQRGGPAAFIPATILIAGFEHLPADWILDDSYAYAGDWSLEERADRLWSWQDRWLNRRAAAIAMSSDDADLVNLALRVATDRRVHDKFLLRVVADFVSDNEELAAAATERFFAYAFVLRPSDQLPAALSPMLDGLIAKLASPDERTVSAASVFIRLCGPSAEPALPALADAASRTSNPDAFLALQVLRRSLPAALETLLELLRDPNPHVRALAAITLRPFLRDEPRLTAMLYEMLSDPDDHAAGAAASSIARHASEPARAAAAIVEQLRTRRETARLADALAATGAEATPYIPDLADALRRSESDRAWRILFSLQHLHDSHGLDISPARDAVLARLTDPDERTREAAEELAAETGWTPDPERTDD